MQIDQTKFFGNCTEVFDIAILKEKLRTDVNSAKEYFLRYFAKTIDDTYFKCEPQEDEDPLIENKDDLKGVWNCIDSKASSFNIKSWFEKEHDQTFKINADPRANRFYVSVKTKQKYINLSKGFMHKTIKPYDSYPEHVKNHVQIILNHINKVWNSDVKESYDYVLNWLSCACTGEKMPTALFLKSGEGTGKSIIVLFLIMFVIGEHLGLITSRSGQLIRFNSQLLGRILVCLEELPSASKSEWHSVSDYLKDLITGNKVDIEKKYADAIQVVNLISLIIITNNENTIKFGKDVRRYMMCDISHDYVGDTEYFKQLSNACNKEAGEAFFMYLLEHKNKNRHTFDPSIIPATVAKLDIKEKNSTHIIQYIKDIHVAFQEGIDSKMKCGMMRVNTLKERINAKYNLFMSTKSFCIALRSDIQIIKIKPYGEKKELFIEPVTKEALLKFYIDKGFWDSKYDMFKNNSINNIKDDDEDDNDSDDAYSNGIESVDMSVNIKKEYEAQIKRMQEEHKKEIELLKMQLQSKELTETSKQINTFVEKLTEKTHTTENSGLLKKEKKKEPHNKPEFSVTKKEKNVFKTLVDRLGKNTVFEKTEERHKKAFKKLEKEKKETKNIKKEDEKLFNDTFLDMADGLINF